MSSPQTTTCIITMDGCVVVLKTTSKAAVSERLRNSLNDIYNIITEFLDTNFPEENYQPERIELTLQCSYERNIVGINIVSLKGVSEADLPAAQRRIAIQEGPVEFPKMEITDFYALLREAVGLMFRFESMHSAEVAAHERIAPHFTSQRTGSSL